MQLTPVTGRTTGDNGLLVFRPSLTRPHTKAAQLILNQL